MDGKDLDVKAIEEAARKGDPQGKFYLSLLYREGSHGYDKSPDAAYFYCLQAAQSGYPPAMYNLAYMLYKGEGVVADLPSCFAWLDILLFRENHLQDFPEAMEFYDNMKMLMDSESIKKGEKLSKQIHENFQYYK